MCMCYHITCIIIILLTNHICETKTISPENLGNISSDGKLIEDLVPVEDENVDRIALQTLEMLHRLVKSPKKVSVPSADTASDVVPSSKANIASAQLSAVSKSVAQTLRKDIFDHYAPG